MRLPGCRTTAEAVLFSPDHQCASATPGGIFQMTAINDQQISNRELQEVLLSADALSRSLEGIVLSRLLAETGLELTGARFVTTPEGRGLVYALTGEGAADLVKNSVGTLRTMLDAGILRISPEESAFLLDAKTPPVSGEQTLVLLKPDNFEIPSIRPGALLDHFARTGLTLSWMGVHHMSVTEAEAFYGPVLAQLTAIFQKSHGAAAVQFLEKEFEESLPESDRDTLGACVGPLMARLRWEQLIAFMTGTRSADVPEAKKSRPGSRKCLALIYSGKNAVARIRTILGPTDPAKAPAGTIRREFGRTLMVNAAHASDSPENAAREMQILDIHSSNTEKR